MAALLRPSPRPPASSTSTPLRQSASMAALLRYSPARLPGGQMAHICSARCPPTSCFVRLGPPTACFVRLGPPTAAGRPPTGRPFSRVNTKQQGVRALPEDGLNNDEAHPLDPPLVHWSLGLEEDGAVLGLPAMDLSLAFPQATPVSVFPPSKSDYYQFDDLLTSEERSIRNKVRGIMEKEIAPIMAEYWEKAEFPFDAIPNLASLGVAGDTIKGYGCPGLSITASAVTMAEIARVDASCSTFILVHSSLAMVTIDLCGSEAQKQKYLPSLAQLTTVGCWALTEPNYGSDARSLITTATKVPGGWLIDGQKRWIGNSTFADVLVVLARNTDTNKINGFIVRKGAPGLKATKIENKIGLRMVQNGDIVFKEVFVPEEDRLPGVNSFKDISKVLAISRIMVAWQPIGISMGVYDVCHRYVKERKQFGVPLAAFQLNQEKLVRMLGSIQAMFLVGWRLCKLYESGKMTPGHASLGKAWTSRMARKVVSLGRELLGGNGILTDFLVAKAFCDLEPIYSYEGTYDINSLVTGREITGIDSIKPADSESSL